MTAEKVLLAIGQPLTDYNLEIVIEILNNSYYRAIIDGYLDRLDTLDNDIKEAISCAEVTSVGDLKLDYKAKIRANNYQGNTILCELSNILRMPNMSRKYGKRSFSHIG